MAQQRRLFVMEADLEKYLLVNHGLEYPLSATFMVLLEPNGENILEDFYSEHLDLCTKYHRGIILDSLGWRANVGWGEKLQLTKADIENLNLRSINLIIRLKKRYEQFCGPIVINGVVGPRCNIESSNDFMTYEEATEFHKPQIQQYAALKIDQVTAYSMTYIEEALGMIKSAREVNIPIVISFMLQENGHLLSGQMLRAAITEADLVINNYPSYYMINCTHFHVFYPLLQQDRELSWVSRVQGLSVDARNSKELDPDDESVVDNPIAFAEQCKLIQQQFPHIHVFGGCCNTSIEYIEAICNQLN